MDAGLPPIIYGSRPFPSFRHPALRRDDSLPAFIAAFKNLGYDCCESTDVEPGIEKVALYVDELHGRVAHAARQLPDGFWTSKLGQQWDINHLLEGVCGPHPAYGRVAQILRRAVPTP